MVAGDVSYFGAYGVNTGILAQSHGNDTTISIFNAGIIYSGSYFSPYTDFGIYAAAEGSNGHITIDNSGTINSYNQGIEARTSGSQSSITIENASGGAINFTLIRLHRSGSPRHHLWSPE